MRTYFMKDRVYDMHNAVKRLNNELSRYIDLDGPFIVMPRLPLDSLEIIGELPGIIKAIKKDEFTKNANWDNVREVESCLKYLVDKVRSIK